jgi:hypothetical protein
MKAIKPLVFFPLFASCLTLMAQDFEARKDPSATTQREEQTARRIYRVEAPNQITGRNVTYGGVVPHGVKLRNPLQLINPFAPLEYGRGDENLAEPMRGDKERWLSVVTIGF